jgi:hypothetical protein
MNIPLFLYGNYNDVLKNVRKLRKICKDDISLISSQIKKLEMRNVEKNDLIVMVDGYPSRTIKSSFFPFVLPSVFLFEESIMDSPIVKWYKEEALNNSWMFLSLLAYDSNINFFFDKDYLNRVLNTLLNYWIELISVGSIYINNIGHCFMKKTTIGDPDDGLHLWEKSLVCKRILRLIGFSEQDVNSDMKILNIINGLISGTT